MLFYRTARIGICRSKHAPAALPVDESRAYANAQTRVFHSPLVLGANQCAACD